MEGCFLLRVRCEDRQAVAAVGPIEQADAWGELVRASITADEDHDIILVGPGVVADIVARAAVAVEAQP